MHLAIKHRTDYNFSEPVDRALQRLRLTPKSTGGQRVIDWSMDLEGGIRELEYEDENCNRVTLVTVEPGAERLSIVCSGMVDTGDSAGIIGHHAGYLPLWHFTSQTDLTRPGPAMKELAARVADESDLLQRMHRLSAAVLDKVAYQTGVTDAATSAEEAVGRASGVCQDHAHIFIGCARAMEVPARYVSGYLMMNDRVDQEAGHAWAEAFVEGLGWVGFDVSNQISPDARYVRVATGRDYREAAPTTGISFGARTDSLSVHLQVAQQTAEQ